MVAVTGLSVCDYFAINMWNFFLARRGEIMIYVS